MRNDDVYLELHAPRASRPDPEGVSLALDGDCSWRFVSQGLTTRS
jgi:hypothetical protein